MPSEQAREEVNLLRKELEETKRLEDEAAAELMGAEDALRAGEHQKDKTDPFGAGREMLLGLRAQLEAIRQLRREEEAKYESAKAAANEASEGPSVAVAQDQAEPGTAVSSRKELEALRKQSEETRREKEVAEAERKAAEEKRRVAEERTRREAEEKRAAEEQARKLTEDQARKEQATVASLNQTRRELEDVRKELEQLKQLARPAPQPSETRAPLVNRPNIQGRNYALIIGNNEYANLPDLKTAVSDAAALSELLKIRYAFAPSDVKLLLNADKARIMDELAGFRQRLQDNDRLLIYYAGHGQIDPVTEAGFWQPIDAVPSKEYTWIANDDIRRQLKGMPAKHVLIVADSCFSGSLTRAVESYANIPKDRFFTEIDSYVSRNVISSGGTEPVADAGSGGHSVFAYYLLKALRENERPYITSLDLFQGLARAVTNNSNQKPEYGTVGGAGDEGSGDFTFILRTGG